MKYKSFMFFFRFLSEKKQQKLLSLMGLNLLSGWSGAKKSRDIFMFPFSKKCASYL